MLDSRATYSARFIHRNINEFYTDLRQLLDVLLVVSPKAHKSIRRERVRGKGESEDHASNKYCVVSLQSVVDCIVAVFSLLLSS